MGYIPFLEEIGAMAPSSTNKIRSVGPRRALTRGAKQKSPHPFIIGNHLFSECRPSSTRQIGLCRVLHQKNTRQNNYTRQICWLAECRVFFLALAKKYFLPPPAFKTLFVECCTKRTQQRSCLSSAGQKHTRHIELQSTF